MLPHPAWGSVFARQAPMVRLVDVQALATDLTTYTFTGVQGGELGSTLTNSADAYGTYPHQKSPGRKAIVIIIHAEDAAATFTISGATYGGVAGTELADRGGITRGINTGIYIWYTDSLQGIASTDVTVTFSEAVTGCAIGVLEVSNFGLVISGGTGSAVGTGNLVVTPTMSAVNSDRNMLFIVGATSAVVVAELLQIVTQSGSVNSSPELLYDRSSAEYSYAALWGYSQQYNGANTDFLGVTLEWASAGAGDAVGVGFM
jgi:hypothetical protein